MMGCDCEPNLKKCSIKIAGVLPKFTEYASIIGLEPCPIDIVIEVEMETILVLSQARIFTRVVREK